AEAAPPSNPEALRHWRLAVALRDRGRPAEALAEIDAALLLEPRSARLVNERARLLVESGQPARAIAEWRRSLEIDPAQPDNWRNLAELAPTADARRDALREAAALGDADAHYLLATLARDEGDWTTAGAEIAAYEALAGPASPYREAARALAAEASERRRGIALVAGGTAAVVIGVPVAWWLSRRNGRTLREVLAAAPGAWHEAARLLSGIRHEVIKHNVTVLPEVATALREGNAAPWEEFAASLPPVVDKAEAYLAALVDLARAHRQRLDVARDPDLGALRAALRRLRRVRRPDVEEIEALSRVVNVEVYDALGRLVREICVLPVDAALVRAAYARVRAEPGFAGDDVPPLLVTGEPLALRLFRPDLEDILVNLLRNALAAGARSLAVELGETEDAITGHLLAEIAVVDDAPGMLTNAMIRSRFIGRGLGLAVDLVNRHGGSIRVDPRAEGRKAVVVQFRAVELGDEAE
ncbi:MAG: hypothetical protein FJ102_21250, partial [Deltaproteobacteria bacterium]|nr:hypothetical protein [Deltaproteobacteria bacterium]